jgi:AcrR family transcriptional regulator
MSRVAEVAGIGRATLYKYFPDVESILLEWHEEQVAGHLDELRRASQSGDGPIQQLRSVLEAFALMTQRGGQHSPSGALMSLLHRGENVTRAEQSLCELIAHLVAAAVTDGTARDDVPPEQLAWFCLHAAKSAQHLPSQAAVRRMVALIMSALTTPSPDGL